jgi:hypothetical protein
MPICRKCDYGGGAQLDFAGVFEVRKPASVLPGLLREISAGQKARAVPASGVYMRGVEPDRLRRTILSRSRLTTNHQLSC